MWWVVVAISTSPAWGTLVWVLWQGQIRPRLLPLSQIEAKAAEMVTQYGNDALEMAAIEEDRAWRYSDSFKQGYWRRVGLAIKNQCKASTLEFRPTFPNSEKAIGL